jgi:hypothetical protein
MSAPIITTLTWEGMTMTITYTPKRFADFDHIEVLTQNRQPIPITETGYRSHFLHHEALAPYTTAHDFVIAWLEHDAKLPEWQALKQASRQLSLF